MPEEAIGAPPDVGRGLAPAPSVDRLDARAKVTGTASYAATELHLAGLAHGWLVGSAIARGRILRIDAEAARSSPGVLDVLTHENAPRLHPIERGDGEGRPGQSRMVLQDDRIDYAGQHVALVVAGTLEEARAAAALVRVEYAPDPAGPRAEFERHLGEAFDAPRIPLGGTPPPASARGDADTALASAPVALRLEYRTPVEHHVALEAHGATAAWVGDELLILDTTQWTYGARHVVATQLGLPEERVRVVCPFAGGAFGSKGSTWPHVTLAAVAARRVRRPVRVALTRRQTFTGAGHRAPTLQRLALGADRDGRLSAIVHEAFAHVSAHDDFCDATAVMTRSLYACPNVRTSHRLVRADVNAPCPMRAPGEAPGLFALESAMDELAYAVGVDPLELRLRNYAEVDGHDGKPFSSKALRECYRTAAERFGWAGRPMAPRSSRDGRWLVGQGMASAIYPGKQASATARVRLLTDGRAEAASATQEIGNGGWTAMAMLAAEALGLPLARVRFEHGDTRLPRAPVTAGSHTTASVGAAVRLAADEALRRLAALAAADPGSPLRGADPAAVDARGGRVAHRGDAGRAEDWGALLRRNGFGDGRPFEAEAAYEAVEPEKRGHSVHAHGAHFCEVRVDGDTGEVLVTRWTGAFACGRIVNAKAARSQLLGGIVWGIGMALHEGTALDPRLGRFVNADLAEYHVPVSADVPAIDAFFVEERDPHAGPVGAKSVGEIGICGAAAAVANAVHHATGLRPRGLPITPDALLAAL